MVELFRGKADTDDAETEVHPDTGGVVRPPASRLVRQRRRRGGRRDHAAADVESAAETIFDRRDAALVPLIVAGARKLKRVLADEQNDVLDALRKSGGGHRTDGHPSAGQRRTPAATPMRSATSSSRPRSPVPAPRRRHAERDAQVGRQVRPRSTPCVSRSPPISSGRSATGSSRCVADGAGDNEEITKRVRAVYREWKTQHIDDQLDDVFRLAYGAGALAAASAGTRLCWMVDPHGPACPDAEDNALAGPVAAGDAFPTGHTLAPAHAGCRCLLAPVPN